ncbi:MAG: hypothetical protein ABW061_20895 [Polyangiaceae bacterium]
MQEQPRFCARLCQVAAAAVVVVLLSSCSSDASSSDGDPATEALIGTWTYQGRVPNPVHVTLTFESDKTFRFVEQVSPSSLPAGSVEPSGCVTTESYFGTYAVATSGATNTLSWTFSDGTANAVAGCADSALDSAGTPMTADGIAAYREQGAIPPATVTYAVSSAALVLNPGVSNASGLSADAMFSKSE